MAGLSGSVGLAGLNRPDDVRAVQLALANGGTPPGPIDNICGRLTLAAIVRYQHRFMAEPDGRVDVHGPTWHHLSAEAQPQQSSAPSSYHLSPSRANLLASTRNGGAATAPTSAPIKYTDHLPLPPIGSINVGILSPPNSLLEARFGRPRENFSTDCQPATNKRLAAAIVTQDVGPFHATGLLAACASLRAIFAEVRRDLPALYGQLGTAGMMCCRLVRGSDNSISNHSWGTAIDMKINGVLVPWRSNYVSIGLAMIAPYFNRHGWFWGAGYRGNKDPHHFECGSTLISRFSI